MNGAWQFHGKPEVRPHPGHRPEFS